MKKKITLIIIIAIAIIGAMVLLFHPFSSPRWIVEEITFKAEDGFPLKAHLLRPENPRKKYPAVACLHQLWGNRDDFLKLYPYLADSGIIAIAPNFPRQRPNMSPRRISDLRDTVQYLEEMKWVDPERLGIITASFSVETGLMAIWGKKNVIADVMLSGPVLSEESRKWLTLNSDLAIFTMTNIYEGKPNDPPKHHLLMEECLARSLNPFSRSMFLDDKKNRFSIFAHGTFVFDEFPEILDKLQNFFSDVFRIRSKERGKIEQLLPDNTIYFPSTDGFPIAATFKVPGLNMKKYPAVILYPPQFRCRTFYDKIVNLFISRGIAVLAPNTKRTCREPRTLHLCDKEINGAINYLKSLKEIDSQRIGILFPNFYYLAAENLMTNHALPVKTVIFMETGETDFGVNPRDIPGNGYDIQYLDEINFKKVLYYFKLSL